MTSRFYHDVPSAIHKLQTEVGVSSAMETDDLQILEYNHRRSLCIRHQNANASPPLSFPWWWVNVSLDYFDYYIIWQFVSHPMTANLMIPSPSSRLLFIFLTSLSFWAMQMSFSWYICTRDGYTLWTGSVSMSLDLEGTTRARVLLPPPQKQPQLQTRRVSKLPKVTRRPTESILLLGHCSQAVIMAVGLLLLPPWKFNRSSWSFTVPCHAT